MKGRNHGAWTAYYPNVSCTTLNLFPEPSLTNWRKHRAVLLRVTKLQKSQLWPFACFPRVCTALLATSEQGFFVKWPGVRHSAHVHTWQIESSYPWELGSMLSSHFLWLQNRQGPAGECWHGSHYWREHYFSVLRLLIIYQWGDISPEKSMSFVFRRKVHSSNGRWPREEKLIIHFPCGSFHFKGLSSNKRSELWA